MDTAENQLCPIACALARVGDAWSFLILRDASAGSTRFDQFRRNLGIAPNILTRRLAALVADGLLEKERYCERPPRDEYRLTDRGREFLPVLVLLSDWGGRHFGGAGTTRLVDAETGETIDPVVVDRRTGAAMGERAWRRADGV
jgi:DNA-binding HxlR family transcriptional regulator